MSLSPSDVSRTWRVDRYGNIEYHMTVRLGNETINAAHRANEREMCKGYMPPAAIEHQLQSLIINHIRGELFPRG
jgi:hypothetical protein